MMKPSKAFTMAEVLITLGIIWIIAAMTLPNLIARQRSKVLEAQFHKRYNEVQQALLMIKRNEMPLYGNYTGRQIQPLLAAQFKGAIVWGQQRYELPVYKTFNKTADFSPNLYDDGGVIISKEFFIFLNTDKNDTTNIQFVIDINGLQKPNIAGYDLFIFRLDKNDTLTPMPVNTAYCMKDKKNTSILNGWTCSYYAMTDKDYFKNLGW